MPVLKPDHPRDPEFQEALARARARLLPGRRLRRPAARSRRSTSRRTAGSTCTSPCLPAWRGAAPVQHALWAGDEVTGATTFRIVEAIDAGPTFGVMTERIRPTRHRRRPARAGSPRAAPGCSSPPSTGSRTASLEAREQPADGRRPGAQDHRRRRPGRLVRARRRRRPPGPRLHAGARRLDDVGRRAGQARAGPPRPDRTALPPGRAGRAQEQVLVGTGTDRGPARRGQGRSASGRCPPPTGPAASGWTPAPGSGTVDPWPTTGRVPRRPTMSTRSAGAARTPSSATSWGDVPTWKVPAGPKGKGFVLYRPPGKNAIDPDDRRAVRRPARHPHARPRSRSGPWSTTTRRRSSPSTTSTATTPCWCSSRGWVSSAATSCAEIITDAWAVRAPKRLVAEHLGPQSGEGSSVAVDPARRAAYAVLKAVRAEDAYANLVLPAVLRALRARRPRRGVRHRAGLGHAAPARDLRRRPRRLRRPAAGQGRGQGARRAAARHPPAARDAGARPRRDLHHRRPGAAGSATGAAGFANAVLRKVAEHDLDAWVARVAPDRGADPRRLRRDRPQPPALGRRASCASAVGDDELDALLAADNDAAAGHPGRPARPADAATSCRASRRRCRRTAWCSTAATPARSPRSPRAGPGSRTRARSWSRSRWPRRRSRAATSAGSTSAPAPAARRRCSRRWRRAAARGSLARRAASRTAPAWSARALAGRRRRARRRHGRRHPPAVPPRVVRPGARRRALHRAGRAAPPARGAVAAQARRPARAGAAAARSCSAPALDLPSAPAASSLYATCSPVLAETAERRHARCSRPAPTSRSRTPRALLAERPRRRRAAARHRPALAAPARHRRDVHRAAAPDLA